MNKQQFPVEIEVVVTQEDGMFVGKPAITCDFRPVPVVNFLPVVYAASFDGVFEIASACMNVRRIRGSLKVVPAGNSSADKIIVAAAKAIKSAMHKNKHWHIGTHSDGTPALDIDSLYNELVDGRIGGWFGLKAVQSCSLSQWSAAVELVIREERNKQEQVDRFDITNRIDR